MNRFLFVLFPLLVFLACGPGLENRLGTASVSETVYMCGAYQTVDFQYTAGQVVLKPGSKLLVQLPPSWIRGNAVQYTKPNWEGYVTAACSNPDVKFDFMIPDGDARKYIPFWERPPGDFHAMPFPMFYELGDKGDTLLLGKKTRPGIFASKTRKNFVATITVKEDAIGPGDKVTVTWGDKSKGGPGLPAPKIVVQDLAFIVAVDTGTGPVEVPGPPAIGTVSDGVLSVLRAIVPSRGKAGGESYLHISCLDQYQNQAKTFSGRIAVQGLGPDKLVDTVSFTVADSGIKRTALLLKGAGLYQYRINHVGGSAGKVSNVMEVTPEMPAEQIVWGELHSHCYRSGDGAGMGPFEYARDVSALDFYSLTDHTSDTPESLYALTRKDTRDYYEPGRFVTLLGQELSFKPPSGHHNVYRRDMSDLYNELRAVVRDNRINSNMEASIQKIWEILKQKGRQGNVLTIPHHPGVFFAAVTFGNSDSTFSRCIEIFSGHGLGEFYDPEHPLSYEYGRATPNSSIKGPHYAQDAWLLGEKLGTLASSDNHTAQPGMDNLGLTALFVKETTREAVFDAIYNRRCYGTTGQRIILDFKINNVPMGQSLKARGTLAVTAKVIGTASVELVEVLRGKIGGKKFKVIKEIKPSKISAELEFKDPVKKGSWVYYLRATQAYEPKKKKGHRLPTAWSSPVWVN
jgi:hypothetical protein